MPLKRLSVAEFMSASLETYYNRPETIGRSGDFVTSPQICSLFGDMVALWLQEKILPYGDQPLNLVELGPGNGLLFQDVWGRLRRHMHPSLYFVEKSRTLKDRQREVVAKFGAQATWVNDMDTLLPILENRPTFFYSNEFLDALPVHQYVADGRVFRERYVEPDDHGDLTFVLGDEPIEMPFPAIKDTVVERCPQAVEVMTQIASYIDQNGGAFLMIDYGYSEGHGDTLQAVQAHKQVPVLEAPGTADITAHVDFGALRKAVQPFGLETIYMDQGDFLNQMGIWDRLHILLPRLEPEGKEIVKMAVQRIALKHNDRYHMGRLFKVFGGFKICKK